MDFKFKKSVALTLAALLFIGIIGGLGFAEEMALGFTPSYGDVNLDGEISSSDVSCIMNYLEGSLNLLPLQLINADVSGNNTVTVEDAELIGMYLSKMITTFPSQHSGEYLLEFQNDSFPIDGAVLPYGKPYSLVGIVISNALLRGVYVRVVNLDMAETEISAAVTFKESDRVYIYNTSRSSNSIDSKLHFAQLSEGRKRIDVYATPLKSNDSVLLYSSTFRIKDVSLNDTNILFEDIAGHVYKGNSRLGQADENKIVDYLNLLDTSDIGSALVLNSIRYLGTDYDEMDCSEFTRSLYNDVVGIMLPRTSVDQARFCINNSFTVSSSELKPGDLVFISDDNCHCGRYHEIHHVSLYLGNVYGTRYFVESSSSLGGVIIRTMWGDQGTNYRIDCYGRPYGV